MSVTQHDCVRDFVAFITNSYEVQVVFLGQAEFGVAVCFAGVGADRLIHGKEDCPGTAIRLLDYDCGVTTAGTGDTEVTLHHRLTNRLCTGDLSCCIEIALTRAKGRVIRPRCYGTVGRHSRRKVFGSHIAAWSAAQLLDITPNPPLGALATEIIEDRPGR